MDTKLRLYTLKPKGKDFNIFPFGLVLIIHSFHVQEQYAAVILLLCLQMFFLVVYSVIQFHYTVHFKPLFFAHSLIKFIALGIQLIGMFKYPFAWTMVSFLILTIQNGLSGSETFRIKTTVCSPAAIALLYAPTSWRSFRTSS